MRRATPTQRIRNGVVAPYVGGMIGVTKVWLEPVEELTGFGCIKSDVM